MVSLQIQKSAGGKDIVSARQLHQFLESRQDFSTWIKSRIEKYEFVEKQDYAVFHNPVENRLGGRPSQEYALTLDMAKELAMVEGNDRGREARRFFIAAEKQLRQVVAQTPAIPALPDFTNPVIAARAWADAEEQKLQLQAQLHLEMQKKEQARLENQRLLQVATDAENNLSLANQVIVAQAPAVALVEALTASGDHLTLEEAAKTLNVPGIGRTNLIKRMQAAGILLKSSKLPAARYAAYFPVRQSVFEAADGRAHTKSQVLVSTTKGMGLLRKLLS